LTLPRACAILSLLSNDPATSGLWQRWRDGDPAAAEEIFSRYAEQLVRVAEQQLARKLAPRLDGEDVVQSVFRTFFRRAAEGQFHIDSGGQLWRLLVKITLLKTRAKARHHTAGPRDVDAERDAADWLSVAAAREPAPEDGVMLLDLIDNLLADLPEAYRDILDMRLEGRDVTDIAARMSLSRRTVHRALSLLQHRLADLQRDSAG